MEKMSVGPKLIIVCGLPGAGKTTHARMLEEKLGAIRFCPDEWMEMLLLDLYDEERRAKIEALQWNLGQELLARGLTVIIEWGTWGRSERDALRLGAKALGAAVELHYLSAPIEVLFERVQRRGMENPPLTMEDLQRSSEIFQAPTAEETALFDVFQSAGLEEASLRESCGSPEIMPSDIRLYDVVTLTEDLPHHGLVRGQVGTVVEQYSPDAFEVEFVDNSGHTYALVTLKSRQILVLQYEPAHAA